MSQMGMSIIYGNMNLLKKHYKRDKKVFEMAMCLNLFSIDESNRKNVKCRKNMIDILKNIIVKHRNASQTVTVT